MNALKIISPGLLSTIQDAGRSGWMASGFPPSGAMDLSAARQANLLAGNAMDFPVLEMTMAGVRARFLCSAVFVLTGADFRAAVNCVPISTYQAVRVKAGDELLCGAAALGCRGYLAVAGGFALESVMGSCSTNLKCGLGGLEGRKLAAGDVLPLAFPEIPLARVEERKFPPPPHLDRLNRRCAPQEIVLRAVPGPQDAAFGAEGLRVFFGSRYEVTAASDRMGVRLEGRAIPSAVGYDIISDGIAAGSVQVPASGKPILLLADRQTTGGYAKIATVITADLPLLAQARPGDSLRFAEVSVRQAQRIARRAAARMKLLEYACLQF